MTQKLTTIYQPSTMSKADTQSQLKRPQNDKYKQFKPGFYVDKCINLGQGDLALAAVVKYF